MNAVHGSIIENLKLIEIIYEETNEAFKKDRTNTSVSKEVTVNQFIESYLPSDFQVKLRSKIYSRTEETNSIDCVVLSPNHPKLITPKREVILAEGVFSAIEVKPDISTLTEKSEFLKGLLQIKSVKNISRDTQRLEIWKLTGEEEPPKYYNKIPCVLFTSKSSTLEKTIKFISKKINDKTLNNEEIPDVIVCMDKGIISYSPAIKKTSLGKHFENKGLTLPDSAFVTYSSNDKSSILILFLRYFLNFSASYHLQTQFIVNKYLDDIKTEFNIKVYDTNGNEIK